jgi:rubrerythrin
MKFEFEIRSDYGRKGPIFYISKDIPIINYGNPEHNKVYVWGEYEARVNGPKTAIATFYKQYRFYTNPKQWHGFHIKKHFSGNNIGKQCRKWLNFLLNNLPSYVDNFKGDYCPERVIQESYYELIMAVENKYPNENRHQTALRLIKEAQQPHNPSLKADKLPSCKGCGKSGVIWECSVCGHQTVNPLAP